MDINLSKLWETVKDGGAWRAAGDRVVLDCYMAGMTCNEIADFLDISRMTVWHRRTRAQVKYKSLFN